MTEVKDGLTQVKSARAGLDAHAKLGGFGVLEDAMRCRTQPLCGRDPACCQGLLRCLWSRPVEAGESIYEVGDRAEGVWQVLEGMVGLRLYGEDGRSRLLRVVRAGGIFGYRAFLSGEEHFSSAYAVSAGVVRHIPAWAIRRVTEADPEVLHGLLRLLAEDLREANQRLLDQATTSLAQRFIRFLVDIAGEPEGRTAAEWKQVVLPISYQDIASLLGVSPETLSRCIRRLEAEGLVRSHRRGAIELACGAEEAV